MDQNKIFDSIDHVAFAVRNIEKYMALFKILETEPEKIKEVPEESVKISNINVNNIKIELITPTENSPQNSSGISNFIEKKGEGFHHICFKVTNIEEKMELLRNKGFSFTSSAPKRFNDGKKILFLHPRSTGGILIELVENI